MAKIKLTESAVDAAQSQAKAFEPRNTVRDAAELVASRRLAITGASRSMEVTA